MSENLRINVSIGIGMTPPGKGASGDLVLAGSRDQLLVDAVKRTIITNLNPNFDGQVAGIEWDDPELPQGLMEIIPQGLTLGHVADYFGDDISKHPPTIRITDAGYGGETAFEYLIEIVNSALSAAGTIQTTLAAQRALTKARYSRLRRLGKDWRDTGVLSAALKNAVLNETTWERSRFDTTFDLGPDRGPELLRMLGYERHKSGWGEQWMRDPERNPEE